MGKAESLPATVACDDLVGGREERRTFHAATPVADLR